jgi:hypothetical protein
VFWLLNSAIRVNDADLILRCVTDNDFV